MRLMKLLISLEPTLTIGSTRSSSSTIPPFLTRLSNWHLLTSRRRLESPRSSQKRLKRSAISKLEIIKLAKTFRSTKNWKWVSCLRCLRNKKAIVTLHKRWSFWSSKSRRHWHGRNECKTSVGKRYMSVWSSRFTSTAKTFLSTFKAWWMRSSKEKNRQRTSTPVLRTLLLWKRLEWKRKKIPRSTLSKTPSTKSSSCVTFLLKPKILSYSQTKSQNFLKKSLTSTGGNSKCSP